jgi:AcrR family transcriptional regulator
MRDMDRSVKADARKDRWEAHRARRRRQFVDAALRVLESQGTDLVMDAVAAEAGVTKPVLYRYFSDKAELLQALTERGSQILLERLLPAINAESPVLARIRDSVDAYFAVIDEHPALYWLLARQSNAEGAGAGTIRQNKEFLATALTAVISDYLWLFGLDAGAAEPWAYGITGLMQSTGEWWLQRRPMSRAHVVAYVTQLIWAAISGTLQEAGVPVDPDKPLPPVHPPEGSRAGGLPARRRQAVLLTGPGRNGGSGAPANPREADR